VAVADTATATAGHFQSFRRDRMKSMLQLKPDCVMTTMRRKVTLPLFIIQTG
jgi:hypothetical protein